MDRSVSARCLNLEDVIRFNEAIDQALAESIGFFSEQVDQARNLLLGMLGHDMRNPLNTILMTASYLAALNAGAKVSEAASRLIRSGASMKALLDDLVDFNRTKLGLGINIASADIDLAAVFADELEQLRGAHPGRRLELEVVGDTQGRWDGLRLQQLLRNLVSNAIKYGAPARRSVWCLPARRPTFALRSLNSGPAIQRSALDQIFDPLKRGPAQQDISDGLGLGLYIVREVARAMGRGRCAFRQCRNRVCCAPASPQPGPPSLISTSLRFRKISRRRSVWPFWRRRADEN